MTYSIAAYDADEAAWGVAVASKAMCVGAHVPWGGGGVGAVATQAYWDLRYGWQGFELLQAGNSADEVVTELTTGDPESQHRQIGVIDAAGVAATFTGSDCMPWAGGFAEGSFAVQGNLLAGPQVPKAMAEAYTSATGPFARRLAAALVAGDEAGGDRRGRQSAAVEIWHVADEPTAGDVALCLRVDDGELPVHELERIILRVVDDPSMLYANCGVIGSSAARRRASPGGGE
jgi:uncharacterized Ntn-hydrolase superfamily protein